ncbi:MAG: patatin family protein [Clostridia bacterium]|nr:patatin family protein [Clostridia bacterium]
MKKGLVLEGGAMRGLFTAGILDVLMENGVEFDGLVGVSAGAAFGCNYKSGQIGRTLRYNVKYCRDKRYCSWRSLFKTGDMYGAEFCYRELPKRLDVFDEEAFDASPMEFYVVATDVQTGKAVYHRCDSARGTEILDWIRASASMPFVSRVVQIGEGRYLDGAMADSVPLAYFESIGYDRNVVILTNEKGYRKRKFRATLALRLLLRKYPKAAEAMATRHVFYNETLDALAEREARGEVLVLRPEGKLPIKRVTHSEKKLRAAYEMGRALAVKRLPEIKAFLTET